MDEAFIIMQIGNADLDGVCDTAIVPAVKDAGLEPRRVDRHNEGDLLKSEIVQFIERSQIIVADLTNERPNCYLEIGYAMGLGKKANLILTAREDHHHSSPRYRLGGPKIHFDLEGYDILFWDLANLPSFRERLAKRISRRASIVRDRGRREFEKGDVSVWRDPLRQRAEAGLSGVNRHAWMEVAAAIAPGGDWGQSRLLSALRDAQVHTFGCPIAITLENRGAERPRPTADGIEAEVAIGGPSAGSLGRASYDFWKLFRDGRFYTLLSLFEDERADQVVFWDVRVSRVTEALFLLVRLYRRLEASDSDEVTVEISHSGLANRTLSVASSDRFMMGTPATTEDSISVTIAASLAQLEAELPIYVKQLLDPLFAVFDFFEVSQDVITDIAEKFMRDERR